MATSFEATHDLFSVQGVWGGDQDGVWFGLLKEFLVGEEEGSVGEDGVSFDVFGLNLGVNVAEGGDGGIGSFEEPFDMDVHHSAAPDQPYFQALHSCWILANVRA